MSIEVASYGQSILYTILQILNSPFLDFFVFFCHFFHSVHMVSPETGGDSPEALQTFSLFLSQTFKSMIFGVGSKGVTFILEHFDNLGQRCYRTRILVK